MVLKCFLHTCINEKTAHECANHDTTKFFKLTSSSNLEKLLGPPTFPPRSFLFETPGRFTLLFPFLDDPPPKGSSSEGNRGSKSSYGSIEITQVDVNEIWQLKPLYLLRRHAE